MCLRDIKLKLAGAKVVQQGVTGHQRQGLSFGHILTVPADDHGQLGLEIHFAHIGRAHHGSARRGHGGRHLENNARRFERLHTGFLGMVGVVAANANDLSRPGHGRKKLNVFEVQKSGISLVTLRQHMRTECCNRTAARLQPAQHAAAGGLQSRSGLTAADLGRDRQRRHPAGHVQHALIGLHHATANDSFSVQPVGNDFHALAGSK